MQMLPELKFNKKMIRAVVEGRKTATRRKDPKDICGGLYFAGVCLESNIRVVLRCTTKYSQKISDMTESDATKEGFSSLEEFRSEIESIYGSDYLEKDPTMWVYEFEKIMVSGPSTELK